MKAALYTLGCKVNQYETEVMSEMLVKNGYMLTEYDSYADVYIVNSCTVTAESDRKSRQAVRRFKKQNPDAVVVLTGCMSQAFPEKAALIPEADIILGNNSNHKLIESIEKYKKTNQTVTDVAAHQNSDKFRSCCVYGFTGRTRATVKIEDGCNRFCSYCIIPYARGRVRSKPLDELKKEIGVLEEAGFEEVVLVGINLSAYGSDTGLNICDAVEACAEFKKIKRIRLGSLEPDHLTDEIIERLAKTEKLCPHFHISLQSGCDNTLKRMNRHYTAEEYYSLCLKLRRAFPGASLTTDVMVGFAGETQEDFEESLEFVKKVGFEKVHVFPYSIREGTRAASFPDQITNADKTNRSHIMSAAADEIRLNFLSSQVGKAYEVLFEENVSGFSSGYTANYIPVKVKSDEHISGIHTVKILSCENDFCIGELVC